MINIKATLVLVHKIQLVDVYGGIDWIVDAVPKIRNIWYLMQKYCNRHWDKVWLRITETAAWANPSQLLSPSVEWLVISVINRTVIIKQREFLHLYFIW